MDYDYKKYIPLISKIKEYDSSLERQNLWWTVVAMVGKVNNQGLEPQLLDSVVTTQQQFDRLKGNLIESLVQRYLERAEIDIQLKSQAFIDILNRNLYERTADVGFLSTDQDLISFLQNGDATDDETQKIETRLQEYVDKYSVYSNVVVFNSELDMVARLDQTQPLKKITHPILYQALETDGYIEFDQVIEDISSESPSLYYLQRITNGSQVLGVLCLSFKFQDELERIYQTLSNGDSSLDVFLMEQNHRLMFSSKLSADKPLKLSSLNKLIEINQNALHEFAFFTKTSGYQGYQGLPWVSYIRTPVSKAVEFNLPDDVQALSREASLFPEDLHQLNLQINTALLIVILNGKISSLKNNVKAFLPVLDYFQEIGTHVRQVFSESIQHIHHIAHQTTEEKVTFSATVSLDVMDRNLYERANDCRWWALNPKFRQVLSNISVPTQQELSEMTHILEYINSLYTVYTSIFVYNRHGVVVSVSNPLLNSMVGKNLSNDVSVQSCLQSQDSQAYQVSSFEESAFYENLPTYIYYAAIFDSENTKEVVGGVGVVFDSEPEFKAILKDFLPKDSGGSEVAGAFSLYVDSTGVVISVTDNVFGIQSGENLKELYPELLIIGFEEGSRIVNLNGTSFIVGKVNSKGYREYKNSDGYVNDVACLVLVQS